jgi:hypothetical protein
MRHALLTAGVVFSLAAAPVSAGDGTALGDRVVAFCKQHRGERVGTGECTALVEAALRAAGARGRSGDNPGRGDYVWGKLVYHLEHDGTRLRATGKRGDIKPGDIIQFRDSRFQGRVPGGTYSHTAPHHSAVVLRVEAQGRSVRVLHQNFGGKRTVVETLIRLDELKAGWLRVYEPLP